MRCVPVRIAPPHDARVTVTRATAPSKGTSAAGRAAAVSANARAVPQITQGRGLPPLPE